MTGLEPNLIALLWFLLFWGVTCVAFLVLMGMFPLASRPDLMGSPAAAILAVGNMLLLAVLIAGTAWFGYSRLRWTSLVVAGGLTLLFAPGLFHLWPERWRDGRKGLVLLLGMLGSSIAALQLVGRVFPVLT